MGVEIDERKAYLLTIGSQLLSLEISKLANEELSSLQLAAINNFLDSHCQLLVFSCFDGKNAIEIRNELSTKCQAANRVVFYKIDTEPVTCDNYLKSIMVLNMAGNADAALYHAVHNVFNPVLIKSDAHCTDPKLQQLLTELEQGLASVVRQSTNGRANDVGGVLSLQDECQLWKELSSRSGSEGRRASRFSDILQPLIGALARKDHLPLGQLTDQLLETAQDVVDDLWRQIQVPTYGEDRMRQLLDAIGNQLAQTIQIKLDVVDLWSSSSLVTDQLKTAISLCDQWEAACLLLTNQLWPRVSSTAWKGDSARLAYLNGFRQRLDQILGVRTTICQLARLFEDKSVENSLRNAASDAFKDQHALHYNLYTETAWTFRMENFERMLHPYVQQMLPQLKHQLQQLATVDSHQLLASLSKCKDLVSRPLVKQQLVVQRETLLSLLVDGTKTQRADFREKTIGGGIPMAKMTPEVVNSIMWTRNFEARIEEMLKFGGTMLNDLSQYEQLRNIGLEFLEEMRIFRREQFDNWCRDLIHAIEDPSNSIGLKTTGKSMELHKTKGTLNVNFSDRLVRLLKEVRQLTGLGYPIPAKIQHCASTARTFYKHAIVLKQVAHFYNTIDQQMLPYQQTMLLDSALAMEKLVKTDGTACQTATFNVTWDSPTELQAYIERLKHAAERLATDNRRLLSANHVIATKVTALMHVDLLKHLQQWKDSMNAIREVVQDVQHQGFNAVNMRPWLVHWDRQLYKTLEFQYQLGLENFHLQMTDIKTELVFRPPKLQLHPPLEEIRAKYYRELRKFLSIPQKFKGIEDEQQETTIFVVMIERNANRFESVYRNAEHLFTKLAMIEEQFKDWVVLGQVNLEQLIEEKFASASDWQAALKMVKTKGRDAERLPSHMKLDCITVSTVPVKTAIDNLLQHLFDTLLYTLRVSIQTDLQKIVQFLNEAIMTLSCRPQSIEEIADANEKHYQFGKRKLQLSPLLKQVDEKNRLLRSTAGNGVEQLMSTNQQWDKFESMLASHQLMIKEQVQVLKSNVANRISTFNETVEKFAARWHQLKPTNDIMNADRQMVIRAVQLIKEKRLEFNELDEQTKKLISDCLYFDLSEPTFPALEEVRQNIKMYEINWLLYEQFNDELQELAKEDWIAFRGRTYLLDEFLDVWTGKIKGMTPTHTTVRIQKDIDRFMNLSPVLKHCRGEHLSDDHWLEMFRLLGLPRTVTLERLTFGDFLSVCDSVIDNVDRLKDVNVRAQGESAIREAIRELEFWAIGSVFPLADYLDSSGHVLHVIKDWKQVVNQVGDNRALLQSLKDSQHYSLFADKTSAWEVRLADLDEFLHALNHIQRKWVYLEPIFGRGALPTEQSRFQRVDVEFRAILTDVSRDPRVVSLCSRTELRSTLQHLLDQFGRCQKALNEFLEVSSTALQLEHLFLCFRTSVESFLVSISSVTTTC